MEDFVNSTVSPELFTIRNVEGDNACLYRSIANHSLYLESNHEINKHTEDDLTENIQNLIYTFIQKNPQKKIPFMGNISIKEAVPMIHDITFEEYLIYYKCCAFKESELDEDFIVDRWGSSLELFVISEIFKSTIIVFNTQKWSNRYNKIINGKIKKNKPEKNVRLKLSLVVGEKYKNISPPIYLIWREYYGEGHYMPLYPIDDKTIINKVLV